MRHFIIVDMQKDFVTGPLGTPEAKKIVPKIKKRLEKAREDGSRIYFTQDAHTLDYLKTLEGKKLPVPHCVVGTKGFDIVDDLPPMKRKETLLLKNQFGYADWYRKINPGDTVTICGVCTDICVVSNALLIKSIGEVNVKVLADCCAGTTPEKHEAALKVMESCQCEIVGWKK